MKHIFCNYRRVIALVLAGAVLSLSVAACGGSVGSVGLVVLDHTKFARKHPTLMNGVRCAYHTERTVHDLKNGHKVYGVIQGGLAAHSCLKLAKHH